MPDCPASGQSGSGVKRSADAGTCPVPNKETQSRYRTEMMNDGMSIPAASALIPMPNYAMRITKDYFTKIIVKCTSTLFHSVPALYREADCAALLAEISAS
jgi:hypothetical protein